MLGSLFSTLLSAFVRQINSTFGQISTLCLDAIKQKVQIIGGSCTVNIQSQLVETSRLQHMTYVHLQRQSLTCLLSFSNKEMKNNSHLRPDQFRVFREPNVQYISEREDARILIILLYKTIICQTKYVTATLISIYVKQHHNDNK